MHEGRRPASGMPLRALPVILLLAGFGLWQAWQCTSGMPASPITGMPAMTVDMATDRGMPTAVAAARNALAADAVDAAAVHTLPPGTVGACITVMAGIGATLLLLLGFVPRMLALLQRHQPTLLAIVDDLSATGRSLTQLCVLRT